VPSSVDIVGYLDTVPKSVEQTVLRSLDEGLGNELMLV